MQPEKQFPDCLPLLILNGESQREAVMDDQFDNFLDLIDEKHQPTNEMVAVKLTILFKLMNKKLPHILKYEHGSNYLSLKDLAKSSINAFNASKMILELEECETNDKKRSYYYMKTILFSQIVLKLKDLLRRWDLFREVLMKNPVDSKRLFLAFDNEENPASPFMDRIIAFISSYIEGLEEQERFLVDYVEIDLSGLKTSRSIDGEVRYTSESARKKALNNKYTEQKEYSHLNVMEDPKREHDTHKYKIFIPTENLDIIEEIFTELNQVSPTKLKINEEKYFTLDKFFSTKEKDLKEPLVLERGRILISRKVKKGYLYWISAFRFLLQDKLNMEISNPQMIWTFALKNVNYKKDEEKDANNLKFDMLNDASLAEYQRIYQLPQDKHTEQESRKFIKMRKLYLELETLLHEVF